MQWTVGQSDLAGALQKAIRLVAPQNTMPILSGVQLTADGDSVHVETTDLTHAMRVTLTAEVTTPGTVVIPAAVLHNLVQKIPTATITVTQEAPGNPVMVRYGSRNRVTLQPFGTETLPAFPQSAEEAEWHQTFAPGDWVTLHRQVPFACAKEDTRPVLKGVAVTTVNGSVEWVATDGSRLSWRGGGTGSFPLHIITPKWMQEVARMNAHDPVTVTFYPTVAVAQTSDGRTMLQGRYLSGEFPAYSRVIPSAYPTTLTVDRAELLALIDRLLAVQGKERGVPLELIIEAESVRGVLQASQTGGMEEWLEGHIEGEPRDVLFNPQFLADAVRVFEGDQVTLAFAGDQAPAKIFDPQDPQYFHLVLPLRKLA